MRQAELKKLIEAARDRNASCAESWYCSENPQIKRMRDAAIAKADAFQMVLSAIGNNSVCLKIEADFLPV